VKKVFEAHITEQASDFLSHDLEAVGSFLEANEKIYAHFGIIDFFQNNNELEEVKQVTVAPYSIANEPDRIEYGDFQTNGMLANKVASYISNKGSSHEIIIEPTCGTGNFIIAALRNLKHVTNIFGIEIYKPYIWETKFKIIDFFLSNQRNNKPDIQLTHCNVFDYDFKKLAEKYATRDLLILGNPPWVTNSKLGSLDSKNLPRKSNFKNHSGLDAMTGKGNFDIAESIALKLIETFQHISGHMLLLVKNTVIKNIVWSQKANFYKIATIEKHNIDSKKEFNVSVEASLLFCRLNSDPEITCNEFNFYENESPVSKFGWSDDKFVSNIDNYAFTKKIDGTSPFIWRQGLKHDCTKVMELERALEDDEFDNSNKNRRYVNGLDETLLLENGLVYGLLKSSDLKNTVIQRTRKYTIVTQQKVGQETMYIKDKFPKSYEYLVAHQSFFNARKSSIYKNKPLFSIFGIGDYSFKPYKVAISGLYKTFHFTLIMPQDDKPVMLDDTCYFIGFEKIEYAAYSLILLNSEMVLQFLKSVIFLDAKRAFTKEMLMRINLMEVAGKISTSKLQSALELLNIKYALNLNIHSWDNFLREMMPGKDRQMTMFS
jgi:hypothetical protein